MPTPSELIIQLLSAFRAATTHPTFARMCLLMQGAILAPGRRTITAALAAVGLEQAADFGNYHEVFNRARWSPLRMSAILLNLLVEAFVPADAPLELVVDETLERRRGRRILWKSVFRDAVLSTAEHLTLAYGIRWVCLCLLVRTPWSQRPWALPFLVVPSLSEKRAQRLGKPYVSPSQWAARMVVMVQRWQPQRQILLVGDGAYATLDLVAACQGRPTPAVLVSRLRLDAVLYDPPAPQPPSKRGPKPQKGARRPSFEQCLVDQHAFCSWQKAQVAWYGGQARPIEYTTGVALWYKKAVGCVTVRWVLLRGARAGRDTFQSAALLCSDPQLSAEQVIAAFVRRWNIEVTFEEMRACLGLETQRHWSAKAIGRTTPALFALFSLVALLAKLLHPNALPVRQPRWYAKEEPTFRDALAAVRLHLLALPAAASSWAPSRGHAGRPHQYGNCGPEEQLCQIPLSLLRSLQHAICYAS